MANTVRARWLIPSALLALSLWIVADLYWPIRHDIRVFNPAEVARLDTQMWRSYYDQKPVKLFGQLTELLQTQYEAPPLRSYVMAYYAARAAFAFKEGNGRADYQKALPYLTGLYRTIRQMSNLSFSAEQAASLELEWWIIHRQRQKYTVAQLEQALARTAAAIYHIPAQQAMAHAQLRAQAMNIRDTQAANGNLTEKDWQQIHLLLNMSWKSLWVAVNEVPD